MNSSSVATPNLNTLWARVLVDELARLGLQDVVISPGSRSAPLVFQFALEARIRDHSIIDERAAGFFALGVARVSGKPVALVCTTGTAAANYFPAICEAARDGIPLLVLSAARPAQEQDCGVIQVIDQTRLYGAQVRAYHLLPEPGLEAAKFTALRQRLGRGWAQALGPEPGPVHFDLPFSKPLEPVPVSSNHPHFVPETLPAELAAALAGRADGAPWLQHAPTRSAPGPEGIDRLLDWLGESKRPLLIAGADPRGTGYREALRDFAARHAIPVLAEPASGLRHWSARGDQIFSTLELAPPDWPGLPDFVLRTGAAPINWMLERRLRDAAPIRHVLISDSPALADPDHSAALRLVCTPAALFERLAALDPGPITARRAWCDLFRRAEHLLCDQLAQEFDAPAHWSAPALWHRIGRSLPQGAALVCSSSMVVRDLDGFMATRTEDLEVYFNRGLNGIDGVLATAVGVAAGRKARGAAEPTVLVIGDIALRHDLGALPMAAELGLDLCVVVIDNDGGEIFDYLPNAGFGAIHERHFLTRRSLPFEALIPRGISISQATDTAGFDDALGRALQQPGLQLIHALTRRGTDQQTRRRLREQAAEALAGLAVQG